MFSRLRYEKKILVNDKEYIVVHAGHIEKGGLGPRLKNLYGSVHEFNLWARGEHLVFGGKPGSTIVFGHTPTTHEETVYYNKGKVNIIEKEDGRRFINIDCGYVYKKFYPEANMAMIRLDDEKIYYL